MSHNRHHITVHATHVDTIGRAGAGPAEHRGMQARPFLETPFAKKVVVAIEMRCGLDFTSPERTFCSHDLSNVEQVGPLPSPTTAGRSPALHVSHGAD